MTLVWPSWEPLGATSSQVRVLARLRKNRSHITQDTSFVVAGEPQEAYSVEVPPIGASGEELVRLQSGPILCAPATLEAPGRPELVSGESGRAYLGQQL